jgi:hypothetical protein
VPRFGHGLIALTRVIEAVMSSAGAAGWIDRLAMADSGGTLRAPSCGCRESAWITTGLDAQPQRLAPIPINKRALPNRIIGPLGHHTMGVSQYLWIARFILMFQAGIAAQDKQVAPPSGATL